MQGSAAPPRATEGDGRPVSLLPPGEGLLLGLPREGFPLGVASLDGDPPQSACGQAAGGRAGDPPGGGGDRGDVLPRPPPGPALPAVAGAACPSGYCHVATGGFRVAPTGRMSRPSLTSSVSVKR